MFGSTLSSGHKAMPSPADRVDDRELSKDFPMPSSLFPQYSKSHPGFENPNGVGKEGYDDNEETVDFLASDGTPLSSMLSPKSNHSKGVKSPDGDKQIPLHVQTDETMSDDEEPVQHPSEFPCMSPPQKKYIIPVFEKANTDGAQVNSKWTRYRLWALLAVVLILLISIIALIARTTGGENGGTASINNEHSDSRTSAPTISIFGNGNGADAMLPPMKPTTPRPTDAPTIAPSIVVPTVAPFTERPVVITNRPTQDPTVRAPTLNRNHPFVGLLQAVSSLEDLVDPYTPQGEAVIWLATTDKQTPKAEQRIFQRYAMVVLDVALHAPSPRFWSSRNLHECRWPGVTCNEERHITEINWAREELTGTIPPELGLLTHLSSLDIAQNNLKGNIEPLYNLDKLKLAYLFENYLTGTISAELENCRNLTRFFAGHNQLSGSIPTNFKMRPLGK